MKERQSMKNLIALILCAILVCAVESNAADAPKLSAAKGTDTRRHADGQGWRLDKAKITDPHRPRVLLIGDSILNGYRNHVVKALEGKASVDAWVNPYHQSEHLNKLLAQVLEHGPYDVVHCNMGLHGWPEGRIKPGTFEPLTRAYVEVIRQKSPNAAIIWASSTPVTVEGKPSKLEPEINPIIVEHNRMAAKVMAEMNVPVNDFYSLLVDTLELARGDRFHWTAPAYEMLAQMATESVLRELKTAKRSRSKPGSEPVDAKVAAAEKAAEDAAIEAKYQAWVAKLPPDQQAWERTLQENLGGFYLPIHKRQKVAGKSNAWDFVQDDPKLPRVLLIGDSVSRGYTQAVRRALAGKANVHRAPANCGPTSLGVRKIDVWLGDGKWDVIHFNFGIHDRNTPLPDYTQRLEQLVATMKPTDAKLIWASTTPIPNMPSKKQTAASIVKRNEAAAELMKKHGVAIDDLFAAVTPHLAELQNRNDVHFNGKGYEFLGRQVAASIETVLKCVGPAFFAPQQFFPNSLQAFLLERNPRVLLRTPWNAIMTTNPPQISLPKSWSVNRLPGLPATNAHGFAHGEPRGQPGRGSVRGRRLAG